MAARHLYDGHIFANYENLMQSFSYSFSTKKILFVIFSFFCKNGKLMTHIGCSIYFSVVYIRLCQKKYFMISIIHSCKGTIKWEKIKKENIKIIYLKNWQRRKVFPAFESFPYIYFLRSEFHAVMSLSVHKSVMAFWLYLSLGTFSFMLGMQPIYGLFFDKQKFYECI